MRRLWLCLPLLFSLFSCEGAITGLRSVDPIVPGPTGPGVTPSPYSCDSAALANAPELPLRRLAHVEYVNTVEAFVRAALTSSHGAVMTTLNDTLAQLPNDAMTRPSNESHGGFTRLDQSTQQATVEAAYAVSVALGREATLSPARMTELMGACATDSNTANDRDCLGALVDRLGPLALRHALSAEDRTFFIESAGTTPVAAEAVADVLAVMTSSPGFLYQLESGTSEVSTDRYTLDGDELAARLSYHFWQAPPDDELRAAASSGALFEDATYRAQVMRLVRDERAGKMVDELFNQWFRLEELGSLTSRVGTPQYDAFAGSNLPTNALRGAMFEEVLTAVRWNITHGGTLDGLLTDARQFTTSTELASIYESTAWDGVSEPQALPPTRSGLLTRAALLANDSANTRPVMKGLRIRNALLCDEIPKPPADLMVKTPELSAESTTRQVVANLTEQPNTSCQGCHVSMNPLGYASEGFDALGRARSQQQLFDETGNRTVALPLDTSALARIDYDDTRLFKGINEVSARIAESKRVDSCFAKQYFRFSFRRVEDGVADACTLRAMDDAARSGSLEDALAAPAFLDSFKTRHIAAN